MRPRQLIALSALSALGTLGYGAVSPALVELAAAYGVSEAAIGVLQGALAMPGIVLTIVLGGLSDQLGRGRVAVGSLLAFSLGGFAVGLADAYPVAVAFRILQGIGFAGLLTIPPAVIGDRLQGPDRQRAVAVNTAILTSASTAAPIIGGVIAGLGDPRRVFLLYGAGLLLIPSTVALLGLQRGSGTVGRGHASTLVAEVRRLGAGRSIVTILLLTAGVVTLLGSATGASLPLLLKERFDLSPGLRGLMIAGVNVGSTVASAMLAMLAGRLSDRRIATIGLSLVTSGLFVLAVAPSTQILAIGGLAMGMGIGSVYNAGQHLASRLAVTQRGLLIGTWSAATRLGQSVGPPAGALLSQATTPGT
ncbi:MFS transporter, partial [Euzebya pacifica]|uniref:MFS transporter n=1 Tax=Euzebya pacifica TaxID=1608957 RepID=UPI0030F682FE